MPLCSPQIPLMNGIEECPGKSGKITLALLNRFMVSLHFSVESKKKEWKGSEREYHILLPLVQLFAFSS